jgi:photosystem II stability/assembly factor-like uncharacterized protein
MRKIIYLLLAVSTFAIAQNKPKTTSSTDVKKETLYSSETYSAFKFRNVGPALVSGRISDIAVNPNNKFQWYIAVASGGVWKTDNAGTSFQPIFDSQSSYSIGCVSIDPNNKNVVWVGTGENNNQRSVAYGDGLYKSEDGGKTWKNVGLKTSEHIGMISIHPNNSNIVYVAAYGPLWSKGGERGIYKTTDGGATWKQVLNVSENTGFNEVHIDKNHPNIVYATAHQRRRHEWTYLSGGPESAIYKSTDEGNTWNKLTNGLPKKDMGRVGLAISPVNTDYIYAIIEATDDEKGFYRSTDRGASWEKRSSHNTTGNYYTEIFADPINIDKVFSMDTYAQFTIDGGKTFNSVGEKNKHVDNHALWIDKDNTNHMLMGCDGGLYETWDHCKTWNYKPNLPITQFYRVSVDNALPFYNIYGGTQDNNTLGGPSRTISASGIVNSDWFITVGGDGFEAAVDPKNPNIVYSQWQYGGLVRFDRKNGNRVDIKPKEQEGESAYRFNWDAPLLISNFDNKRIYFAAQKVFRSDDMGNSWKVISPDLSRGIDRNKLPIMDRFWGMDGIAINASTSIYGNITALAESPKNENLIYAGTDDGLIQITTDGGKNWTKVDKIAGVPNQVLVHNIIASKHNENVVYAVFNNHRSGDFKPYVVKSNDKGKTWALISGGMPERGSAYTIAEDHKNSNLLFVGTEFGVHFTIDGGTNWMKLSAGLPTICVRDIAIQERENDLVLGTFGRGFYVLDDYSPLQTIKKSDLEKKASIFDIKDGLVFIPSEPYGDGGKASLGESFYTAPNPEMGATFTYYLKDDYKTIKEIRQEKEKERIKNKQVVYFPSADSIRLEDNEETPYLVAVIKNSKGEVVRKLKQSAKKGIYRVTWSGKMDDTSPININAKKSEDGSEYGPMALPGEYKVQLVLVRNGETEILSDEVKFRLNTINNYSTDVDNVKLIAFYDALSDFRRVVSGVNAYSKEMENRVKHLKAAVLNSSKTDVAIVNEFKKIELSLQKIDLQINGDKSLEKRDFETVSGYMGRVNNMVWNIYGSQLQQTITHENELNVLKSKFGNCYNDVKAAKTALEALENKLENLKVPYTPGRLPNF